MTVASPVPAPLALDATFDPFAEGHVHDPYPYYDDVRARGPVTWYEPRNIWLVTGFDAARTVLRQPDIYTSALGTSYERVAATGMRFPFLDNDAPEHTRVRRSVQRWFTPAAVHERQARVASLVGEVLGGVVPGTVFDAMAVIGRQLPGAVTREVTGVTSADIDDVARWADAAFHLMGPEPSEDHLLSVAEGLGWLATAGLADLPGECLASAVMAGGDRCELAEEGDERLLALASIWVAGVDTTTAMIGNAIHAFATFPAQWDLLRAHPELTESAVDECLRYEAPIRMLMRRTAAATELEGVPLPADADLCLLFGAANRDPQRWDNPAVFDITRSNSDHLAFGSGAHRCLGSPVARLELAELLGQMGGRFSRIVLAEGAVRNPSTVIRGFRQLPIELWP